MADFTQRDTMQNMVLNDFINRPGASPPQQMKSDRQIFQEEYSSQKSKDMCDSQTNDKISTGNNSISGCMVCGKSLPNIMGILESRGQNSESVKQFRCKKCRKNFHEKCFVIHNMQSHPDRHICKVCKLDFYTESSLSRHSLIHECADPYRCERCGKSFTLISLYNDHINQLACKFPSRRIQVKQSSTAKERLKNIESKSRYYCDDCGASFACKTSISRHKRLSCIHSPRVKPRTRSPGPPFQCGVCGCLFQNINLLTTHITLHTNERPCDAEVVEEHFRLLFPERF